MIDQKENQILHGVIWKQLLLFFFPIMMGTFFQIFYNTVDAIVVGRYVGTTALAAVGGPTGTLINLIIGFFVGLTSGSTVVIAQYYGSGDVRKTSRAVHTSMALALAGGVLIGLLGIELSGWALDLMGTPEEVMPYAHRYLTIFLGGSIFSLVYNMGSSILRARGDSKRPFYLLAFSSLLNIGLDMFLVVGMGWGVAGVAWATVISQACCAAGVWACLALEDDACRLTFRRICFDRVITRNIIAIGLPAAFQGAMYGVSNVVVQSVVNSFGVTSVAAWTVFTKIDVFYWQMMNSFGVALTTFSGQNFGARQYDRVISSIHQCTVIALIGTLSVSGIYLFFARQLATIFTADAEVISTCVAVIGTMAPYYFTYVPLETVCCGIRSTGDSFIPTVMMATGVCFFRLFWAWCVVPFFPSILTLGRGYPVSWLLTSIAFLIYHRYGNWLERSIVRAGHRPA